MSAPCCSKYRMLRAGYGEVQILHGLSVDGTRMAW